MTERGHGAPPQYRQCGLEPAGHLLRHHHRAELTGSNHKSVADEIAWFSAICFLSSLALSYSAIRKWSDKAWEAIWADRIFMMGILSLTVATLVVGTSL